MLRAAIILWGKLDPASQSISVLAAVSLGTEDLTDDEKTLFSVAQHDSLVGSLTGDAQQLQSSTRGRRRRLMIGS